MAILGFLERNILKRMIYFNDGYLFVKNRKFLLVSASSLGQQYIRAGKACGLKFWAVLYCAGKDASTDFIKEISGPVTKHLVNLLEFSCESLNALGEGNFRIQKYDDKKPLLVINADKSTLAEEAKKFGGPVDGAIDYFLLGLFVGFLEYQTKQKLVGFELNCKAENDVQSCTFIVAKQSDLVDYVKKFAPGKTAYLESFVKEISNSKGM